MEVLPSYDAGQKGDLLQAQELLAEMSRMATQVSALLGRNLTVKGVNGTSQVEMDAIYQAHCLVPTGAIMRTSQWVREAIRQ